MIDKILKIIKFTNIGLIITLWLTFTFIGQGFLFTPLALASIYYFLTED